jgi:hypothetical protein
MVLIFFIVLIKAFIYVNTRYELTIFIFPDNSLTLRGFSPQAYYTDRATAACRRN